MSEVPLISIVDDDALARNGISELVESLGYETVTFSSAEHLLESDAIAETKFAAVLQHVLFVGTALGPGHFEQRSNPAAAK